MHAPGQDFEILTTTRAWVAVPWEFNSCIGLRFRADGSGDMVFARLQIVRAEIKFRFSLQIPNELALIYHDAIVWKPFELKEGGKSKVVQYSLKEGETTGVTANIGPFKFYWTLSLEMPPFPDEVKLGVVEQPLQFYGHNVNEATRLANAERLRQTGKAGPLLLKHRHYTHHPQNLQSLGGWSANKKLRIWADNLRIARHSTNERFAELLLLPCRIS